MATTPNLGLHYYGGDVPGSINDNGSQHTGADRLYLDQVITQLGAAQRHYIGPEATLSATPDLELNPDGGTFPGSLQVCYRIGLVGLDGFERVAGPEASIFTSPILLAPDAPGLRDSMGALPPGLYYYALTAKTADQESILGPDATVTVFQGVNDGVYVDAPDDDQDAPLQVWRKKDSDPGYTRLAVIAAGATYLDDGSIPAEKYAMVPAYAPPQTNNGPAVNSITVSLTGDAAAAADDGRIKSWRLYRTLISGFYSSTSLVHDVIEKDNTDGSDLGPLRTVWVDTGDALLTGTPSNKDRVLALTPYAPESVTALPTTVEAYPENYPVVYNQVLYLLMDGQWTPIQGGGGGATAGDTLPTTSGRGDGDLHFRTAAGEVYLLASGAWQLVLSAPTTVVLTSPNGTRFQLKVADDGTLSTLALITPHALALSGGGAVTAAGRNPAGASAARTQTFTTTGGGAVSFAGRNPASTFQPPVLTVTTNPTYGVMRVTTSPAPGARQFDVYVNGVFSFTLASDGTAGTFNYDPYTDSTTTFVVHVLANGTYVGDSNTVIVTLKALTRPKLGTITMNDTVVGKTIRINPTVTETNWTHFYLQWDNPDDASKSGYYDTVSLGSRAGTPFPFVTPTLASGRYQVTVTGITDYDNRQVTDPTYLTIS